MFEMLGFLLAFAIANKHQRSVRIIVTAMFGSSLIMTGGCIMFDILPSTAKQDEELSVYLSYITLLTAFTALGLYTQQRNSPKD
jgi:hypothetical protein